MTLTGIGPRYRAGRLVLVLENLRDFGGWDLHESGAASGMRWLASLARIDWTGGRRRLFRTKAAGHGGTGVWAQAVSYAATWLATTGLIARSWPGDVVPTKVLAETIDHVAMVQHVKCSPLGSRSNPNDSMWVECGRYVLRDELAILRPARLLVIGSHHNAGAMRARVLSGKTYAVDERTVMLGTRRAVLRLERGELSGHPVDMVVVQHPASPGGTSRKLVEAFRDLVHAAS